MHYLCRVPWLPYRQCLTQASPCAAVQGTDLVVVEFAINDATFRVPEASCGHGNAGSVAGWGALQPTDLLAELL